MNTYATQQIICAVVLNKIFSWVWHWHKSTQQSDRILVVPRPGVFADESPSTGVGTPLAFGSGAQSSRRHIACLGEQCSISIARGGRSLLVMQQPDDHIILSHGLSVEKTAVLVVLMWLPLLFT